MVDACLNHAQRIKSLQPFEPPCKIQTISELCKGESNTLRYRGVHHLPHWLEQGAPLLRNNRTDDLATWLTDESRATCIEIGCGKGGFLHQMATLYPDKLFIGIDKVPVVAAKSAANAVDLKLTNVRFIIGDVEHIAASLTKLHIERLFLNFSDPWPRRRHESRRLTAPGKLKLYETLLRSEGYLEQKTDNRPLFEWSLHQFEQSGWAVDSVDFQLPQGVWDETNVSSKFVQTEYEQKFRQRGMPIHYLRARPK